MGDREKSEKRTACFTSERRMSEPATAFGAPPLVRMDLKPREMRIASCAAICSEL